MFVVMFAFWLILNGQWTAEIAVTGLVICGQSPNDRLVEMVEDPKNLWHLGVQFHPEFKSRPNRAHPLFRSFIHAALENKKKN